jgi:NAD(P)-dependent dehydrogenase (short-subunit alcohol dehydrogenase family)
LAKLNRKVALITGGTRGIGYATALLFLKEGAKVAITGRSERRGKEAVDKLNKEGFKDVIFIQGDVSKTVDAEEMIKTTIRQFRQLNILVNNAGIYIEGTAETASEAAWDSVIDVNLKGTFLCSKFALPYLKKTEGVIVNIASCDGLVAEQESVAYCASKGGVVLLTKAMALDHAKERIRVNCVCPGAIMTSMLEQDTPKSGIARENYFKEIADLHPIRRIGDPEEVAKAVLFLASDDSSFITGAALSVDGGYVAQ